MNEQNNRTQTTPGTQQKDPVEEVKQKVGQTAQQAQEQAGAVATEAKAKAADLAGEAKEQVGAVLDDAKEQAAKVVNQQKEGASERMHGVADALRQSGRQFEDRQESTFAGYINTAADQVEEFAGYLESRDLGDMWQGARNLAQRQPELFVAGSLAAGFILGRFLKSTQNRTPSASQNSSVEYRRYMAERTGGANRAVGAGWSGGEQPRYTNPQRAGYNNPLEDGGKSIRETYGGVGGPSYPQTPGETVRGVQNDPLQDDPMYHKGADAFNGERATKNPGGAATAKGAGPDWEVGKESNALDPEHSNDPQNIEESAQQKGEKKW